MKKIYLFSVSMICSLMAISQNIHIYDTNHVEITGQSLTITGASDVQLEGDVLVEQKTGSTKDIGCRRYEISIINGTMNYFCWWQCYAPQNSGTNPVWTAPDPLTMLTDSVYHNFHGYHNGLSNPGTATYRYVFYDINNPNDSAFVDIIFDTWPASINEQEIKNSIQLFPNPAKDYTTITYDIPNNRSAKLIITDIVGKEVLNTNLPAYKTQHTVNVSNFKNGVYFYSIIVNGKKISTKKFIVFH